MSGNPIGEWLDRTAGRLVIKAIDKVFGISATPRASAVAPAKVPPSRVMGIHVIALHPRNVTLAWTAPDSGTRPFGYTVFVRKRGDRWWAVGATSTLPMATVFRLLPDSLYDFEIFAHNN